MQRRLAATQRDDRSAEIGQAIDAAQHDVERDGARRFVVLVTIRAMEITAADGNDLREDGVRVGLHRAGKKPNFPDFPIDRANFLAHNRYTHSLMHILSTWVRGVSMP